MSGSCWLQGWTCDTCVFGFVGSVQQHPLLMHWASRLIAFADIELQVIDVVAPSPLSVTPYVTPVQAEEEGNRSLTGARKTIKVGSQIHHSSWSLMISGCARLQDRRFLLVQFLKRSDKYEVFYNVKCTWPLLQQELVLILFALLHTSSTFSSSWINHCKIWRSNEKFFILSDHLWS